MELVKNKSKKLAYIIGAVVILLAVALIIIIVSSSSSPVDSRPKLVFASSDSEKIYDGSPLTKNGVTLLSGSLEKGHTAEVNVFGSRTDAGVSDNLFSVVIKTSGGADVTNTYNIEHNFGKLTVYALRITIKTAGASKQYDGTAISDSGYEILTGEVLSGHNLTVETNGSRIEAGISPNTFTATVADSNSNDVTSNYDFLESLGELEILKRPITIKTPSYIKVYDGTPLTLDEYSVVSSTKVLQGHTLSVTVSGTQTDAGMSANSISEVKITSKGADVTKNYEVTLQEGDLIVEKRNITIRSESDSKTYDGKALTNDKFEILSLSGLVNGHQSNVLISGSRTAVGQSDNTIADVEIKDSKNKDVTFNYKVEYQEGTLTVYGEDVGGGEEEGGGTTTGSGEPGGAGSANDPNKNGESPNLNESGDIGGGSGGTDTPNSDAVAARIMTEKSGTVYLRYMSFGNYGGTNWDAAREYSGLINEMYSLNYLSGISLKHNGYKSVPISIEVFGDNYLLPLYLDTDLRAYEIQKSDVKNSGNTGSIYSAYYYPFNYNSQTLIDLGFTPYNAIQSGYNGYVNSQYLSLDGLSGNGLAYINQIIANEGFSKNQSNIITSVANYIQKAAAYSLEYDTALDSETDMVYSFLSSYKKGVCRHYASSATLLFRALGIPARYTIGYVIEAKGDNEWTEIPVTNAHAWVEVYVEGIGWINVEVTGSYDELMDEVERVESENGDPDQDEDDFDPNKITLEIKPVDLYKKYTYGAELAAGTEIQGLNYYLLRGYTYDATISGKQDSIGIGVSKITSFTLYDPDGVDITDNFNITKRNGKLHLYLYELKVTTGSLSKVYDSKPLKAEEDAFEIDGSLIKGHSFSRAVVVGSQIKVGISQNSCEFAIVDESGDDVAYMYRIVNNYGTLTVTPRNITITAGSDSKRFDGIALTCSDYTLETTLEGEALGEGDTINVTLSGSQTAIGKSQNEISDVKIYNYDGIEVTGNYSITFIAGWLKVTP